MSLSERIGKLLEGKRYKSKVKEINHEGCSSRKARNLIESAGKMLHDLYSSPNPPYAADEKSEALVKACEDMCKKLSENIKMIKERKKDYRKKK